MNTPNAENNVEALSKYGRDLVEEVKNGKIDPIIGRDDEDPTGHSDPVAKDKEQSGVDR